MTAMGMLFNCPMTGGGVGGPSAHVQLSLANE